MRTVLCIVKMNKMICCVKNGVVNACSIDVLTGLLELYDIIIVHENYIYELV